MPDIKFIYFDLGNVLLNFSHQQMVEQVAEVCRLSADQVQTHMFDNDLENRFETGLINSQQFYTDFCAAAGIKAESSLTEAFELACGDIFWLHAPTMPIVSQLSQTKIPIGILSNTCQSHWDFVRRRYGVIKELFPTTVTSFEAKSMKPDAKIYQLAIEKAGVKAHEIFFTDDKLENVQAAQSAGMDAVQFVSASQLTHDLVSRGVPLT